MAACVLLRLPPTADQVTVRPSKTPLLADTSVPAEFVLTLAVTAAVWLVTMVAGLALTRSRSQGVKVVVPPARSHGAALGPVLQPHQLLVAVTVLAATP